MAPSTLGKAIGAVKDQTSIGIAKVASNMAPELEVDIVKATSNDDDPADEKYVRQILSLTSYSGGYVRACVNAVSRLLGKISNPGSYYQPGPIPVMPYGMPPVNGMGPPAGYYHTPY